MVNEKIADKGKATKHNLYLKRNSNKENKFEIRK